MTENFKQVKRAEGGKKKQDRRDFQWREAECQERVCDMWPKDVFGGP